MVAIVATFYFIVNPVQKSCLFGSFGLSCLKANGVVISRHSHETCPRVIKAGNGNPVFSDSYLTSGPGSLDPTGPEGPKGFPLQACGNDVWCMMNQNNQRNYEEESGLEFHD